MDTTTHQAAEAHEDDHSHEHPEPTDYTHTNREFFDKIAHEYDERPHVLEAAAAIGRAFLKEYNFDEEKTHVMEFACGTGESI